MSTTCDQLTEDLSLIVEGDRAAIDRHADHLAGCDACRDARHEATQLARLVAATGSDFVPSKDLAARLLAALDKQPDKPVEKAIEKRTEPAAMPAKVVPIAVSPTPTVTATATAKPKAKAKAKANMRTWLAGGAATALAAGAA